MKYTLFVVGLATLLASCSFPLKKRNILVIGDSNGAAERGWVYQLQQLRGGGLLTNTARSGNTVGFTDAGDRQRNTLENLNPYLRLGYAEMGAVDDILIALGTNDCKQKFSDRHDRIIANLDTLLVRTERFFLSRGQEMPRIVLISPPPAGPDDQLNEEFQGAESCTAAYTEQLRALAAARSYCMVDWQQRPGDAVLVHSDDGIHFNEAGYRMLTEALVDQCY